MSVCFPLSLCVLLFLSFYSTLYLLASIPLPYSPSFPFLFSPPPRISITKQKPREWRSTPAPLTESALGKTDSFVISHFFSLARSGLRRWIHFNTARQSERPRLVLSDVTEPGLFRQSWFKVAFASTFHNSTMRLGQSADMSRCHEGKRMLDLQ